MVGVDVIFVELFPESTNMLEEYVDEFDNTGKSPFSPPVLLVNRSGS